MLYQHSPVEASQLRILQAIQKIFFTACSSLPHQKSLIPSILYSELVQFSDF